MHPALRHQSIDQILRHQGSQIAMGRDSSLMGGLSVTPIAPPPEPDSTDQKMPGLLLFGIAAVAIVLLIR